MIAYKAMVTILTLLFGIFNNAFAHASNVRLTSLHHLQVKNVCYNLFQ